MRKTREGAGQVTGDFAPEDGRGRPEDDAGRLKRLADVSTDGPSKLSVFKRAFYGKSLRASVNAFCLECLWLDAGAIRDCGVRSCPLWNVRPYQPRKGRQAPAEASARLARRERCLAG